MIRFLLSLLIAVAALQGNGLRAHELSMAELEIREFAKGQFSWNWLSNGKNKPISSDLTPVWPEGCVAVEQSLKCPDKGMVGNLSVQGVGKSYSAAMVKIFWRDGQTRVYAITSAQPRIYLYGAANDERGSLEIVTAYTALGVEHILSGFDHLLFVISLLFLVGFNRRLVLTITSFTIAHSITLASSALGLLTLRSPPVEAAIALSVLLVAVEALRGKNTLAKRWPAMVALVFGLLHGFGFAGALKEIGLPENHLPIALLTFNIGVEIGQIAVVLLAWVACSLLKKRQIGTRFRTPVIYIIGAIAGYWSLSRIAAIFS
jgi:hydrogenase/urease accessory protein HupE